MEMLTAVNGGNKDRFGEAYGKKADPACSAGMRMHDMDVVFPDELYKKPDILPCFCCSEASVAAYTSAPVTSNCERTWRIFIDKNTLLEVVFYDSL